MRISTSLILVTLVGVVVAGSACTQKAADDTKNATSDAVDTTKQASDTALDATKDGVDKALDATKEGTATVIDETKQASEKTADATRNIAQQTSDKTKEIAGQTADKTKEIAVAVGSKTKEVVSTTGEVITDGWITTKVSAKFVDETLLKGSNINVDTNNHVVTLKGTVGSDAAKARANAIASGTEGVTRVVNQLVVKGA
jgi:osmotically-inducible protein OsmY